MLEYRLWVNKIDANTLLQSCEKCEENCLNCDVVRKQCTQCAAGYYLSG